MKAKGIEIKKKVIELCPVCGSNNLIPYNTVPKPLGGYGIIPSFEIKYSCQFCDSLVTIKYETQISKVEFRKKLTKKNIIY